MLDHMPLLGTLGGEAGIHPGWERQSITGHHTQTFTLTHT